MTSAEWLPKPSLASVDAGDLDHLGRYSHDDLILHDPNGPASGRLSERVNSSGLLPLLNATVMSK